MLRLGSKIVWKSQLHKAETFTSEEVALVVALKLGGGCVKRNPVTKYMHISPDGRILHMIYKILKILNPGYELLISVVSMLDFYRLLFAGLWSGITPQNK